MSNGEDRGQREDRGDSKREKQGKLGNLNSTTVWEISRLF